MEWFQSPVFDFSAHPPVHAEQGRFGVKIDDYFVSIERGLNQNPQISKIEEPLTLLTSDDYNGLIRCWVTFWDGSFLDIYEVVSTELGYPVRINSSKWGSHQPFQGSHLGSQQSKEGNSPVRSAFFRF